MNITSYQAICSQYLGHIDELSHEQMLALCQWIIRHIVAHTPDGFADDELPAEQPLLIGLKSLLSADAWDIDAVNDTLQKLLDISDSDDHPADMDVLPLMLMVLAEHYTDMHHLYSNQTKMLTGDMIVDICADVMICYFDYLDYIQDERCPDVDIALDKWGDYTLIKDGISLLDTQIKLIKR